MGGKGGDSSRSAGAGNVTFLDGAVPPGWPGDPGYPEPQGAAVAHDPARTNALEHGVAALSCAAMGGPDAGRGRSTWRGRLARRAGDVAARLHLRASPLRRLVRGRGRRFTGRLALVAVALLAAVVAWPAPPDRHRAILDAIHFVETGGRDPCPDGDGGRAIGPYQIHRVYWLDAVAFDPSLGPAAGFDYEDCRRRDYAERVIAAYMQRWVPDAWRTGDAEVIARTHNGGPRGAQSGATAGYWSRVRAYLGE